MARSTPANRSNSNTNTDDVKQLVDLVKQVQENQKNFEKDLKKLGTTLDKMQKDYGMLLKTLSPLFRQDVTSYNSNQDISEAAQYGTVE